MSYLWPRRRRSKAPPYLREGVHRLCIGGREKVFIGCIEVVEERRLGCRRVHATRVRQGVTVLRSQLLKQ